MLRILIELFETKPAHVRKIHFGDMIDLIILKECPIEIKQKVLVIIDHFIYEDKEGDYSLFFVK